MDDALVHVEHLLVGSSKFVLIFVVMDDALVPKERIITSREEVVLILVVMDDALVQQNLGYALFKRIVRLVCAS